MKKLAVLALGFMLMAGVAFATFVWPTRYSYERTPSKLVRIDRFSGTAEYLSESNGWISTETSYSAPAPATPAECAAKARGEKDPWSVFTDYSNCPR